MMNTGSSEIIQLMVSQETAGMRLDAFISGEIEELSRNYAQQLIETDRVSINDKVELSKKKKVKEGDMVEVDFPEPKELEVVPENIPLEIVYEDDDVIVVNKPRGMVVHPSPGNYDGTLVNAIMYHCGDSLSSINGVVRPGIVHRIDKDTSGLLMIAKNNKAHESLAAPLNDHSCTRVKTALVYDNIKEDEITIDEPIGRDEKNRLRRAVRGSNQKNAVTHIRVEKRYGKYTLVTARLETGRTHQIRVHMAYIKHPLVGDTVYGPKKQTLTDGGQMLHAGVLGFVHPSTGEYMEFESQLPEYFADILAKLNA
ncbi:MAG: RluA family pseudouridine synthase [Clostridiales bacterium]|nr:RluA family pseudouridine synthase [Candidatus Crickella merdequi]